MERLQMLLMLGFVKLVYFMTLAPFKLHNLKCISIPSLVFKALHKFKWHFLALKMKLSLAMIALLVSRIVVVLFLCHSWCNLSINIFKSQNNQKGYNVYQHLTTILVWKKQKYYNIYIYKIFIRDMMINCL